MFGRKDKKPIPPKAPETGSKPEVTAHTDVQDAPEDQTALQKHMAEKQRLAEKIPIEEQLPTEIILDPRELTVLLGKNNQRRAQDIQTGLQMLAQIEDLTETEKKHLYDQGQLAELVELGKKAERMIAALGGAAAQKPRVTVRDAQMALEFIASRELDKIPEVVKANMSLSDSRIGGGKILDFMKSFGVNVTTEMASRLADRAIKAGNAPFFAGLLEKTDLKITEQLLGKVISDGNHRIEGNLLQALLVVNLLRPGLRFNKELVEFFRQQIEVYRARFKPDEQQKELDALRGKVSAAFSHIDERFKSCIDLYRSSPQKEHWGYTDLIQTHRQHVATLSAAILALIPDMRQSQEGKKSSNFERVIIGELAKSYHNESHSINWYLAPTVVNIFQSYGNEFIIVRAIAKAFTATSDEARKEYWRNIARSAAQKADSMGAKEEAKLLYQVASKDGKFDLAKNEDELMELFEAGNKELMTEESDGSAAPKELW